MIADSAYGTGSRPYIPDYIPGGPPGPGTGCMTGHCPHCGAWHNRELYEAWRRLYEAWRREQLLKRAQRAIEELNRLVRQFTEECRQAREEEDQDQECNAIGRKPQHKWGKWRKRQPPWARESAFVRETRRSR